MGRRLARREGNREEAKRGVGYGLLTAVGPKACTVPLEPVSHQMVCPRVIAGQVMRMGTSCSNRTWNGVRSIKCLIQGTRLLSAVPTPN